MALLGSSVDPRLFIQDYSGFVDAAKTQAQAIAGIGQTIGQGIKDYQDAKEQRKKLDAGISASRTGIESAIKMGEAYGIDVKSALQPVLDKMNDPNTTPYEAAMLGQNAGEQIANVLKLGMTQAEMESQKQKAYYSAAADIEKARLAQEARAKEFKLIPDFQLPNGNKAPVYVNQLGEIKDLSGNYISSPRPRATVPQPIDDASNIGGEPLPEGAPPSEIFTKEGYIIPANEAVISLDGTTATYKGRTYQVDLGVLPPKPGATMPPESNVVAANIQAANAPTTPPMQSGAAASIENATAAATRLPGEVISAPAPIKKVVTGEEAEKLNLNRDSRTEVTFVNGQPTDFKVLEAAPQKESSEAQKAKIAQEKASAIKAAESAKEAIKNLNELAQHEGFTDVFGTGVFLKHVYGTPGFDAEVIRKNVVAKATMDAIEIFRGLGAMSDADRDNAAASATLLSNPGISEKRAAQEINNLRSKFANAIRMAEDLGKIEKGKAKELIDSAMKNLSKGKQTIVEQTKPMPNDAGVQANWLQQNFPK